ncbi:glycerol-3-phosphate dehydrogenase NAD+,glycosomal/mitochondrial [Strigomonas culicis]|uniref:Glycerol-3-phosphate dehydrogenase [NAD(+)] n=1 Tax=Strigomonas culicis TaxID=28005 RepID=S9VSP8_9TRYP|nr:glycerol-3-phosphate dehydrogenase NAD+,glycosomal/mitochondrial [Strigomonas culicis]|eukprot:EPY26225.1 glycerol-3-phosphate dehydrogenase NAD+,glycosomal/mitochondrial [Strigomonas culicis]
MLLVVPLRVLSIIISLPLSFHTHSFFFFLPFEPLAKVSFFALSLPLPPLSQMKLDDLIYLEHAAVFGSGAFGTSLATVLARKCKTVSVWHMNEAEAKRINDARENVLFLKGPKLPPNITFTSDVAATYKNAGIILFIIPTQFLRGFLKQHGAAIFEFLKKAHVPVLVCSKGIEKSTLKFPAQIVGEFFPQYRLSVLAGPSFAIEVAEGKLTNVAVASENIAEARRVMLIMSTKDRMFRCWATTDTIGCEVASAMKNVLAIASGISKGLGNGYNARAALISRGLLEIRDLTRALGGNGEAVFGLAGLGDLMLTCSSELSRNFSVGQKLGQGITIAEIMKTQKAVAEGVATAEPLYRLAKQHNVKLRFCKEVYSILYQNKNPRDAFRAASKGKLTDEGLPPLFPAKL